MLCRVEVPSGSSQRRAIGGGRVVGDCENNSENWLLILRESSQVKSSQVQISMAAAPAAFGAPAGARDREGAARRNRHGWIALSRGFIHIVFFLIIAAPQVTNFEPFSRRLQYGNATRLQADDGSDRGPARGLL